MPFPVISAAANGDTTAMCADLEALRGLHSETLYPHAEDDAGNTYSYVDEECVTGCKCALLPAPLLSCRIIFSPCGSVSPFHASRYGLFVVPQSISAVDVLLQADKAYCSLTKKAAFGAQHNRQTGTFRLYRASRRVRHDSFSP